MKNRRSSPGLSCEKTLSCSAMSALGHLSEVGTTAQWQVRKTHIQHGMVVGKPSRFWLQKFGKLRAQNANGTSKKTKEVSRLFPLQKKSGMCSTFVVNMCVFVYFCDNMAASFPNLLKASKSFNVGLRLVTIVSTHLKTTKSVVDVCLDAPHLRMQSLKVSEIGIPMKPYGHFNFGGIYIKLVTASTRIYEISTTKLSTSYPKKKQNALIQSTMWKMERNLRICQHA